MLTGCSSVPLSLAKDKCAHTQGCLSVKEIHRDQINALMVIDLGVDNNCKRSEVAQYVNVQNMDGWKFVQSEIKSDCEEKELIGVKEKFDEWKKNRLLERVSETHR
jgi:hypothetical protein